MNPSALHALADAAGVAAHWTDAFGHPKQVDDDSLRAVLQSLGWAAASDRDCHDALSALAREQHRDRLPPLLTAVAQQPVVLPRGALASVQRYRVTLEGGTSVEGQIGHGPHGRQLDALPMGYHRLEAGGQVATLAVAPPACWRVADSLGQHGGTAHATGGLPWGIAAQLYSLRRLHDGGLADFTALESLARAAAAQGASALAVSPVHAMFSAVPERFSPYGPSSRLFFNALHIDPVRVMGEHALAQAMAALPPQDAALLARHEADGRVDWPVAGGLRLALLRHLFRQFTAAQGLHEGSHRRLREFADAGGQALERHARFEALDAWLAATSGPSANVASGDWRRWPAAYRDPDGPAVHEFAAAHAGEVAFHRFLQWLAAEGLQRAHDAATSAGMPIGLVADLAVGADPGGSQAWSLQTAMLDGLTVGAPPDLLAPQGQGWGLGALSPRALQAQGFAPWIAMLRANMRHSGGIRIDHILGMMRLWLVPDGLPASAGAYVRYPFADMLRLVALESHRHRAIVIGEDLGTVPDGFSDTLAEAGVLGIRVLWFQRQGQRFIQPSEWPASAMATTSTHDLATIAGWWSGRDVAWRDRLGLLGNATLAHAQAEREADKHALWDAIRPAPDAALPQQAPVTEALAFTASTPAALMMAPLEDVLGLIEQPNLPGTVDVHPNWQQRLPDDARTLLGQPAVVQRLAALRQARGAVPAGPSSFEKAP